MQIIPVSGSQTKKEFLKVPHFIYKNDPNWICPLDQDIEKTFDPDKNPFFKHGECTRWILKDDQGNTIGRVAAFINRNKAYNYEQPTGGMGFF
ncbi:MAG TPA: GNAT family N-acetyltransferase, partial [Pedobacter sp.]